MSSARSAGQRFNGEDFIAEAVRRGAVAVVARPEAQVEGVPHLAADEPRKLFAELAARYFAPYPDTIVAVTGTNGKTSTVELTRQLWRMAGHRSASIGTLGVTTADDQVKTGLTTPDIVTFLSNMAGLKRMGISHVAYEASSHGLDQYRAEGRAGAARRPSPISAATISIIMPTWTPISRPRCGCSTRWSRTDGTAVVWTGDAKSAEVIEQARDARAQADHGRAGGRDDRAGVAAVDPARPAAGASATTARSISSALPLIGAYQMNNVLTAAGLVLATGGDWATTLAGMGRVSPVRGRLERAVISRAGAPVYVDYAHTPDAVEAAIEALRPHVEGPADHRARRGRRPRRGQAAGNGRGRGAASATW